MNLKYKSISLLLIALIVLSIYSAYNPVKAGLFLSPTLQGGNRVQGANLVIHDNSTSTNIRYYAILGTDYSTGALGLAAYVYSDNSLALFQVVVTAAQWIGGDPNHYGCSNYALSNIRGSTFYMAYQRSINSLACKQIIFTYTAGVLTSFTVGQEIPFTTAELIFDNGISVYQDPYGKVTIADIEVSSILTARFYQVYNGGMIGVTSHAKDYNSTWSVQLAYGGIGYASNNLYAHVYSSITLQTGGALTGDIVNVKTGETDATAAFGANTGLAFSSTISLTNGSMFIVYWDSQSKNIQAMIFTAPNVVTRRTVFAISYLSDISAFHMPNGNLGFFFTDYNGLEAAYCSLGSNGQWQWSAILSVYTASSSYTFDHVYADANAMVSAATSTYPSHPTCWVYNSYTTYYQLVSIDLFGINGLSVVTTYQLYSYTTYLTSLSTNSYYSATTTNILVSSITASALQTPTFLVNTGILLGFILVPAGVLGAVLGFLGYALGATVGVIAAFTFGQVPLWVLLVMALLMTVLLLMFRGQNR